MIHFVAALHCEAQSIIQHYCMKPCGGHGRAQFFEGEKGRLAITGVGSLSSAIATTAMGERFTNSDALWLNVGVCGHESAEIGTTFIANKISSDSSKERFYPQLSWKSPWSGTEVKTLGAPSFSYEPHKAYEMEAYGFYTAALLFSSAEKVQCVKIVSDNAAQPLDRAFEKEAIAKLIATQIPFMDSYVAEFEKSYPKVTPSIWVDEFTRKARSSYSFTETERHQFYKRLQRLDLLLSDEEKNDLTSKLLKADKRRFLSKLQDWIDFRSSEHICR